MTGLIIYISIFSSQYVADQCCIFFLHFNMLEPLPLEKRKRLHGCQKIFVPKLFNSLKLTDVHHKVRAVKKTVSATDD